MIEEIVPLSEEHFAPFEIALKYLDKAMSFGVFVFEDSEFTCLGHRFFNFQFRHVKVIPFDYFDGGSFWNLSPYRVISDGLVTHDFKFGEIFIELKVFSL